MGKKRKRGVPSQPAKRVRRTKVDGGDDDDTNFHHPVLSAHYPRVVSLRTYLLELLPASSRARRRRIASEGIQSKNQRKNGSQGGGELARILDSTLVGVSAPPNPKLNSARQRDFATFSQTQARSSDGSAGSGTAAGPTSGLGEVRHGFYILLSTFWLLVGYDVSDTCLDRRLCNLQLV